MDASSIVSRVESQKGLVLKEFQRLAIESIVDGHDVFVCAPTGSGKSLCYFLLPDVFDLVLKDVQKVQTVLRPIVVVLSPLVALIKDQVEKAEGFGLSACGLTEESTADTVREARQGLHRLVFLSPEGALGGHQDMLTSDVYKLNIVAVIVDEAHCITEWYVFIVRFENGCDTDKRKSQSLYL